LYKYFPSTQSYFTVCQPDGFTCPMEPRSSVGIRSVPIQAYATPQRPSESKLLYSSKEEVMRSASVKSGTLLLMATYGSPENAGLLPRSMAGTVSGAGCVSSCGVGSSVEVVVVCDGVLGVLSASAVVPLHPVKQIKIASRRGRNVFGSLRMIVYLHCNLFMGRSGEVLCAN